MELADYRDVDGTAFAYEADWVRRIAEASRYGVARLQSPLLGTRIIELQAPPD